MSEDAIFQKIAVVNPPTEEQIARARIVVCANSADATEAETLLSMIGLL